MANIQIKKGVSSVTRESSDGTFMPARGTRDGSLYTADWYDALALEGRVFTVNAGSASTPIAFAGAYDATAPDLAVDVPDGTILIPLFIQAYFETGSTGITEVTACASSTLTAVTAGTVKYAKNVRIDQPIKTVTTCYAACDGSGATTPYAGDYFEFWRSGYPTNVVVAGSPSNSFKWTARNDGPPPIIMDGGSLTVYCAMAGATGTGFIIASWVELPESFVK